MSKLYEKGKLVPRNVFINITHVAMTTLKPAKRNIKKTSMLIMFIDIVTISFITSENKISISINRVLKFQYEHKRDYHMSRVSPAQ